MEALKLNNLQNETLQTIKRKKDYVNPFNSSKPKEGVMFVDFIDTYVEKKSKRRTKSFSNQYNVLINHLNTFCVENNANIYTNSVTEDFLDDFIEYLESRNLKINTIKGIVEKIKTMVRKAATYGYAIDATYDDVTVREEESFAVFLSMNDIARIYYFKGLTKFQERIKDLFVVGCLTALRYSDYSTLNASNFQDGYIVKLTQKTKTKVRVPMHDFVREIIDKYEGQIPSGYSIQYFNKYLKVIMQKIGFNDKYCYNYTKGGKLVTETKSKWELISSHTARRSAATNLYLTGRLKTYEIMSLTGHSSEKNFFRYIKITTDDKAKAIAGDVFFKK